MPVSEVNDLGVPKPSCFKPGCLQFLCGCALLRPFAFFCRLAFGLFCAHLRSFARICVFLRPTAFRMTAFGNCRITLSQIAELAESQIAVKSHSLRNLP